MAIISSLLSLMLFMQVSVSPLVVFATTNPPATETAATQTTSTVNPDTAPAVTETPPPAPALQQQTTTTETEVPAPQPKKEKPPKPPSSPYGPSRPGGADANTFQYNWGTGLWENDYYTWNPFTHERKAKPQPYTYNSATGNWETTSWHYSPAASRYLPTTIVVANPPAGARIAGNNTSPPGTAARAAGHATARPFGGSTVASNDRTITLGSSSNAALNAFYNTQITNNLDSDAISGDAAVLQNTTAGSAMTGDAAAMANIINMLQSSWSPNGSRLNVFSTDIYGDVVGDLYIDPEQLGSSLNVNADSDSEIDINIHNNGRIDNNIDLNAVSGDANVKGNTKAGDAVTGNADAVANIVNLMNSSIAAGDSFFGILNIWGNLEGDILMPPKVLENLLASNSVPKTTVSLSSEKDRELIAELTNNQTINNNVSASASSGNALVSQNTKAGDAITGDAQTNVTLLNLTGRMVVGENAMLVFVNVLGQWVGLIMDAPAGSTAAAIGSGDTEISSRTASSTEIDAENNSLINNNVNVNAESGNATVRQNTTAGDAITGNATASINLLNIMNSQFALSDWFGVLFINVFGSWRGSFGVDTAMGNGPIEGGRGGGPRVPERKDPRVFSFNPGSPQSNDPTTVSLAGFSSSSQSGFTASAVSASATPDEELENDEVLGENDLENAIETPASTQANAATNNPLPYAIAFGGLAGAVAYLYREKLLALLQRIIPS